MRPPRSQQPAPTSLGRPCPRAPGAQAGQGRRRGLLTTPPAPWRLLSTEDHTAEPRVVAQSAQTKAVHRTHNCTVGTPRPAPQHRSQKDPRSWGQNADTAHTSRTHARPLCKDQRPRAPVGGRLGAVTDSPTHCSYCLNFEHVNVFSGKKNKTQNHLKATL